MRITIIGTGPGDLSLISPYATNLIQRAAVVFSSERLFDLFRHLNKNTRCAAMGNIEHLVKEQAAGFAASIEEGQVDPVSTDDRLIAVLVSGDVGFFSLSSTLQAQWSGSGFQVEWVNGFSSLQYFAAQLQRPYEGIRTISVHGRDSLVVPHVSYCPEVFVLTGGKTRAQDVIAELVLAGLASVQVDIGEDLAMPAQRLVSGTAGDLVHERFGNLAVMLIRNSDYQPAWQIVRDEELIRGKVPMTKQDVRDISIAQLQIAPTDTVYDIGAGTGAVSIAMARRAYAGQVLAIEKNPAALDLLGQNRLKLGAYNLQIIAGFSPQALDGLPVADKVFIGGSSGQIAEILDRVLDRNPLARFVINAITIETLKDATEALQARQIDPEIICLNVARAEVTGRYHMMKAQNPVYVICGGVKQ